MDQRRISSGYEIPSELYSDQPFVVKASDGAWVCVMTTGKSHEGSHGQHVISTRSLDCGQSWANPVDVEPADGPEASYAVALTVPSGRIYSFYNHNTDNLREVLADNPPYTSGKCSRVDSQGHFVFRYSDDGGRSWSPNRYEIRVREMEMDRQNVYGGRIRFFWNVGKPFVRGECAYVPLHKVGGIGEGFFTKSEGVFLLSDNLLSEPDPAAIRWETLPDGEIGLRTPKGGGPISEEHSTVVLSDGSLYCVYRSIDGHPVCSTSRDGGHTWSPPTYQAFADGRLMKHPRAANFAWKCENGRYLYWFHNNGGRWYDDRNPVWLCGGVEANSSDGKIVLWSQPEIALYDDDPFVRMSYPDLVEEHGRYFLTETQKDIARVHEIPTELVEGLWGQFASPRETSRRPILKWNNPASADDAADRDGLSSGVTLPCPILPTFCTRDNSAADFRTKDLRSGFTVEVRLQLTTTSACDQILASNRDSQGHGFALAISAGGRIELVIDDGRTRNSWDTWPDAATPGQMHHLVAIVDGGPRLIAFVLDGRLCDGGAERQFGWGRFSPNLRDVNGRTELTVSRLEGGGMVTGLRIYDTALTISDAVGNFRCEL